METILIVDDNADLRFNLSTVLKDEGYVPIAAEDGKRALKVVEKNPPNLVLLDIRFPGMDGMKVLEKMKKLDKDLIIIMLTAYGDVKDAVKAMKLGAFDYISKPFNNEELILIIERALKTQRLSREVETLRTRLGEKTGIKEIAGQSPQIKQVLSQVKAIAPTDMTVIIKGESGTGKELIAQMIHQKSLRKDKPFVAVDCATLPETLVESELFGYEKGAFTGADACKIGKFEAAEKGTVFLDEIGNLTTQIQVKLLRVLQERKIERLGGQNPIEVDVRIISATNRDLDKAVRDGELREDLYHRVNVFEIVLPPLREREDDIVLLSRYFLDKFSKELNKSIKGFSDEVIELFKYYSWPGNVRELENTVKSAIVLAKDRILPVHLPYHFHKKVEIGKRDGDSAFSNLKREPDRMPLKEAKRNMTTDLEKHFIEKTLADTNWNKKKAAKVLDIDYKSLFRKIKKYGINR